MTTPALDIHDLSYRYPDGSPALDHVDLTLEPKARLAVIGLNGAGKSTLLLHLNGLLQGGGRITVCGTQLTPKALHEVRRKVGLVFQNPDDQLFCPTVYDDVAFGPRNMGLPEPDVARRVHEALDAVGLDGMGHKNAFHLSFGQKRRAALATVLSMDCELLALDEPTSNLDPKGRKELLHLLKQLDKTLIIATHDLGLVTDLCTDAVLLENGRAAARGTPHDVLARFVY